MGRGVRLTPKKLGRKLKQIRLDLAFTQEEIRQALNSSVRGTVVHEGYISQYERGIREPLLVVLLAYARLGGVTIDYLADDKAGSRNSATN